MANKNLNNAVIALLAGVGIGAVAGVLFAPEKGTVLRKKIKDNATCEAEKLNRRLKGLKKKFKNKAEVGEQHFEERFNHLIAKADQKSDEVIATLEKKLAELKELKAKSTNK